MRCSVCQKPDYMDYELNQGVCATCITTMAIVAPPPSTRPPRPCRMCDGRSFVRIIPREYWAVGNDYVTPRVAPMYAVQAPGLERTFWGSEKATPPTPDQTSWGLMELFVCRGCNAAEWYCHDAAKIPIGAAYNTELVEYPADGAYR